MCKCVGCSTLQMCVCWFRCTNDVCAHCMHIVFLYLRLYACVYCKFSVVHAACAEQDPLVGSCQFGRRFQRFVADGAAIRLQRQLLALVLALFLLLLFVI